MTALSPQAFHILVALAEHDQHGYGIMQDVGGVHRLHKARAFVPVPAVLCP